MKALLHTDSWSARLLQRLLLLGLALLAWAYAARGMPAFVLPGPMRVVAALHALLRGETFLQDLGITLYRVLLGFAIAAVLAAPLGVLLGARQALGHFVEPVLSVLNTVSSAIWAVFAIIWFGISDATTVFVVFMTAMPLILTNVWQGAQSVDANFVELARSVRLSSIQVLTKIYVPSILPHFFAGARLAFGFGWRVSLVAETIGASNGIGYRLRQAADLVQTDQVFAWTLVLVVLMLALEGGVLKPLERRLFRWKKSL